MNKTESKQHEECLTKRSTVSKLEEILYKPIKVLDHGFIRIIDYMGDDISIVQAARVSYGKGTKQINQDKGLINYLMRNKHTSPFEMCEIKLHIKLPIFVARQWIRHRTANVNEYSARYSILNNHFYLPKKNQLASQSKNNKQGRKEQKLNSKEAQKILDLIKKDAEQCYCHYQEMINEDEKGNIINSNNPNLARELARMNLTLNFYTEWYWKIDLRNLLHFLSLRTTSHAQYEIREYANKILDIVKIWTPLTYDAFMNHCINSANISEKAIKVIQSLILNESVNQKNSGLSLREWSELRNILTKNNSEISKKIT